MTGAPRACFRDQQEATLCAHPQLACAIENQELLTDDSVAEQTGAGLDRCSADEFSEFALLNKTYIEKFGFPFIIAVKGHDRYSILKNFRSRLQNSPQLEFETAINEVCRIAKFRIEGIASV
jgi:2-oxo-4-hydroxy-4-carboxy-5-ureidoimidazoline decarboxylase